jgi:predicted site-specific integrase-resolvase
MKLSAYARNMGVHYRTAFRWFKSGLIQGRQMDTGTIIIAESTETTPAQTDPLKIAIYTRVSAAENEANLEGQAKRLQDYCAAKGYPVAQVVKDAEGGLRGD